MSDAPQIEILFLSGMHRSGTSHLAKIYHDAGMPFPGTLLPPNSDNPEGYWEAKECVSLNNAMFSFLGQSWKSIDRISQSDLSALHLTFGQKAKECLEELRAQANASKFAIKDPRFCRLFPVWKIAAQELRYGIKLHATYRTVEDVSRSLFRRARDLRFREAAIDTPSHAILLWLRYNLDLRCNTTGVDRTFSAFDDLKSIQGLPERSWPPESPEAFQGAKDKLDTHSSLSSNKVYAALAHEGTDIEQTFEGWRRDFDQQVHSANNGQIANRTSIALQKIDAKLKSDHVPIITFVSGAPNSKGHIYRVENRIFSLAGGEVLALRGDPETAAPAEIVAISDVIVIFRRPMDAWQRRLIDRAHQARTPVVFDIDDLVFDHELMEPTQIRYLSKLSSDEIAEWRRQAKLYREAIESCDQVWLSTSPLASQAARFNSNVRCLPNGLSDHQLRAKTAPASIKPGGRLSIGYASGTPSHDNDFGVVAPALRKILEDNKNITLNLLGELGQEARESIGSNAERILHSPSVDYYQLSSRLLQFDINLAPLETDKVFCQCKSELKYFEAAAVAVPTVMSPTVPFLSCANGGSTGLLAQSTDEWHNAIQSLIDDAARRIRIGQKARAHAEQVFGPRQQKREFLEAISTLLTGFSKDE